LFFFSGDGSYEFEEVMTLTFEVLKAKASEQVGVVRY